MTDALFAPLFDAVRRELETHGHLALAIDGDAAAGKTTLAARLCELFPAACVHMDDFFLPPELRTPERLAEPGGNVHRERFAGEVLSHLGGGAFSYRRFDCSQMHLAGAVEVPDAPLLIVEGSYSMLPQFRDSYGLSVFLATDLDTQLRRIAARGGADKLEAFRTRWIPMEKAYHDAFGVRSACRFAFDK